MIRTAPGISALAALLLAAGCTSDSTPATPAASGSASGSASAPATPGSATSTPVAPAPSVSGPTVSRSPAASPSTRRAAPPPALATATARASTARRPVVTVDGLGPYRVGADAADLVRAGRLTRQTGGGACEVWYQATPPYAPALSTVQVRDGSVRSTAVTTRAYATASGARVGMTVADLRRIYGDRLLHLDGPGVEFTDGWTVRHGGRSAVFPTDARDRVTSIVAGVRADAEGAVTNGEYYPC
jgi:hypothetical protein